MNPELEGLGEYDNLSSSTSILFFSLDERESDAIENVKQIAKQHMYTIFFVIGKVNSNQS